MRNQIGLVHRAVRIGNVYALFVAWVVAACGDDVPKSATFVAPVLTDQCVDFSCSSQGVCMERSSDLGPICECNVGYAGNQCERCESGFHRDYKERCVADKRCSEQSSDPCGVHGDCTDDDGVIACVCDTGYEGPRCQLCTAGYENDGTGDCLQRVLQDGKVVTVPAQCSANACNGHGRCKDTKGGIECECYPGYVGGRCDLCGDGYDRPDNTDRCVPASSCNSSTCGGCVVFDGGRGFPTHPDTCNSRDDLTLDDVTLTSIGGDGKVWLCAQSSRYTLMSEHISMEVGVEQPARLEFSKPIIELAFDYAGWDTLMLEVIADEQSVGMLEGDRYMMKAAEFKFDRPTKGLELRSSDGSAHTLALDNLVYEADSSQCP